MVSRAVSKLTHNFMKKYSFFCILGTLIALNSCIFQSNPTPVFSKMQSKYELIEIRTSGKIEDVRNNDMKKYLELKSFTINTLPSTYADSIFYFENNKKVGAYKVLRIIEEKNKNKYTWAILELSNKKYLKVERGQYYEFETSEMLDKYDADMGFVRYQYRLVK